MPDQNLISKNLKLLKIDIWVHSILLILSIIVFSLLIITNFDKSQPEHHKQYGCGLLCMTKPTDLIVVAGFFTLSSIGILAGLWQLISLFLSRKYKTLQNQTSKFVRKLITIYYYLLIFSLISYLIFTGIWSDYFSFSLFSSFFVFSLMALFAISPIFWLVYYINLFGQRRFLKNYPLKKL